MRPLFTLLACLMLLVTAWGSAAQAQSGIGCNETAGQMAVHGAGDCDERPADADKNYAHCHTGCHGHHIAAPILNRAFPPVLAVSRSYVIAAQVTLTAHPIDQTLRPPQA